MKMRYIAILLAAATIAGCSTIDIKEYSENSPRFDIFDYFNGNTTGWGIVQSRSGKLNRQFVVDMKGTVDAEGNLVMEELFDWSDGEKSSRTWIIQKEDEHNFSGQAKDLVGTARGKAYGNAMNWRYQLLLDVNDTTWKINFDDWMFLQPDDVLINRASMSKFGFHVGDVIIFFKK